MTHMMICSSTKSAHLSIHLGNAKSLRTKLTLKEVLSPKKLGLVKAALLERRRDYIKIKAGERGGRILTLISAMELINRT